MKHMKWSCRRLGDPIEAELRIAKYSLVEGLANRYEQITKYMRSGLRRKWAYQLKAVRSIYEADLDGWAIQF